MAISYTWDVNTVEVHPSHDGNENVIHTVHWKLKGVDGSYQHTEIGIANLNTEDIESFISFDSLDSATVEDWVTTTLGDDLVAIFKESIESNIARQKVPTTVLKELGS